MKFEMKIAQKLYDMTKPKPHLVPKYANFIKEHAKKTNTTLTEAMTNAKPQWDTLSDAQKSAYTTEVEPPSEYPRKLKFYSDKAVQTSAKRLYLDSIEDFMSSLEAMKVGVSRKLKTHVIKRTADKDGKLSFTLAARTEPTSE